MDGWLDGWMDGWVDGWMDGWGEGGGYMDGWMDRWMLGWMGRERNPSLASSRCLSFKFISVAQTIKLIYPDLENNKIKQE